MCNNYPRKHETSLIHNDYKYDNIVLSGDNNLKIKAVLDWEMATIGDPLMDLGTTLGYWIHQTDPDFIKSNLGLMKMIYKISDAKIEDGGSGAFYIYLKKKFKE